MSSIRKIKSPPVALAKAHGYKAERILPKWIKPVGEGAKRVRIRLVVIGVFFNIELGNAKAIRAKSGYGLTNESEMSPVMYWPSKQEASKPLISVLSLLMAARIASRS